MTGTAHASYLTYGPSENPAVQTPSNMFDVPDFVTEFDGNIAIDNKDEKLTCYYERDIDKTLCHSRRYGESKFFQPVHSSMIATDPQTVLHIQRQCSKNIPEVINNTIDNLTNFRKDTWMKACAAWLGVRQ